MKRHAFSYYWKVVIGLRRPHRQWKYDVAGFACKGVAKDYIKHVVEQRKHWDDRWMAAEVERCKEPPKRMSLDALDDLLTELGHFGYL